MNQPESLTDRLRQSWWDPSNPHLFTPRALGWGWDINFGAAAVRLGLIEPDAEDSPLTLAPRSTRLRALAVPVALGTALPISYAAARRHLPAQVPTHWGPTGQPDRWRSPGTAFALPAALAVAPTVVAAWQSRQRNGAVWIGVATFAATLAASIWALTLATALAGAVGLWIPLATLLPALAAALGVLTWLARAGRRAEIDRDLGR